MATTAQVSAPPGLPFPNPNALEDHDKPDGLESAKDAFRSKLEPLLYHSKSNPTVPGFDKLGDMNPTPFVSQIMQSSFVKDIEDATRDNPFASSFQLPYGDVGKLSQLSGGAGGPSVNHFIHHQLNPMFDGAGMMSSSLDPDFHMHGLGKSHLSGLSLPQHHLRLLDHKSLLSPSDLPQPPMGMGSMSFPKLNSIGNHPSMSDLEGVRNGLPIMSGMTLSFCQPLPGMMKAQSHLGVMSHPVSNWTQGDVLQWLDKILLGSLKPVFQKHEISGDMLLDLAEEDLKNEMGIHSGIVRRKLMRELEILKQMHDPTPKHSDLGVDQSLEDIECDLSQCVIELNQVMHEEGLSQPKVARALGIQSQGHLSELLRGKYKHSRNSSSQHWAKEIRNFLSLTPKERQDAISIYGQAQSSKKRKSSKRTVWSKEQGMMLENFFRQKPSPSKPERQLLASQCGVEVGVINTYFQNKRRRSRHLQPPM